MNIDIQSTSYKGELMNNNEHLLIPDNAINQMIDSDSIANACVSLLDIAARHNNIDLSDTTIVNSVNIDEKTIRRYREEIKKGY